MAPLLPSNKRPQKPIFKRARRTLQPGDRPSQSGLIALDLAHPAAQSSENKLVVPPMSVQSVGRNSAPLTFEDILVTGEQVSENTFNLGALGAVTLAESPFAGGSFSRVHVAEKNDVFSQVYAAKEVVLKAPSHVANSTNKTVSETSFNSIRDEVNISLINQLPLAPHYAMRVKKDADGAVNDRVFLFMPAADGSAFDGLRAISKNPSAKERMIMRRFYGMHLLASVSRDVATLHHNGFIHNDIKLPNIFLSLANQDPTRQLLLGDFGLAEQRLARLATDGHTPEYLSPEARVARANFEEDLENKGTAVPEETDGRANDIFALGVSAIEAFLGYNPFEARGWTSYIDHTKDSEAHRQLFNKIPSEAFLHAMSFTLQWESESENLIKWTKSPTYKPHKASFVESKKVAMIFQELERKAKTFVPLLLQMTATNPQVRPSAQKIFEATQKSLMSSLVGSKNPKVVSIRNKYLAQLSQTGSAVDFTLAADPFVHDERHRQQLIKKIEKNPNHFNQSYKDAVMQFEPAFTEGVSFAGRLRFTPFRRNSMTTIQQSKEDNMVQGSPRREMASDLESSRDYLEDVSAGLNFEMQENGWRE